MVDHRVSDLLSELSEEFAAAIPAVDREAEHERWKPGIGPLEEESQVEMILQTLEGTSIAEQLTTEQSYPEQGFRCDLVLEGVDVLLPIEVKLLRFRYDNGNIDPNSYARIFTPFPERSTSSLLTDAKKLYESDFDPSGGLLGIYYEEVDEVYDQMDAELIAEKFSLDVDHWYDFGVEVSNVAYFGGLQHPHHEQGAVIAWRILDE